MSTHFIHARRSILLFYVAVGMCPLLGCMSSIDDEARAEFFRGNYQGAAQILDRAEWPEGGDRLLYMMDRGVVYHTAERFQESNNYLLNAAHAYEEMDITRVSGEAASLITSDAIKGYRGEDYEQLLIHLYLAMNYLLAGDPEEAAVECKLMHVILNEFSENEAKHYKLNAFCYYLSGLIYELNGEPAEAYIDYKRVYELVPGFQRVRSDLLRLSGDLGFREDRESWEGQFGAAADVMGQQGIFAAVGRENSGEVVALFECGRSPEKIPSVEGTTLVEYQTLPQYCASAAVYVDNAHAASTQELHNLEATIVQNWQEYLAGQVVEEAARIAIKEAVSEVVEDQWGEGGGDLARLIFLGTQQPDVRCWLTLPRTFQIARFHVPAGLHTIHIQFIDSSGSPVGMGRTYENLEIRPGDVVILSARSIE